MDQDHSSAAPGHARFEATRWSVVLEAAQSRAEGGPEALARLCQRHAQLLREEVAQTVLNPNDVEVELHSLCEALVQAEGRVGA